MHSIRAESVAENQTTWERPIVWVVFDNLSIQYAIAYVRDSELRGRSPFVCMVCCAIAAIKDRFPDVLYCHLIMSRRSGGLPLAAYL